MPTICIHCALECLVAGTKYTPTDETPEEHMKRVHPNGVDPAYRAELERKAATIIKAKLKES